LEKRKKSDNSVVVYSPLKNNNKKTNPEAHQLHLRKTIPSQCCLKVQWCVDLKDSKEERVWPPGQFTEKVKGFVVFFDLRSW